MRNKDNSADKNKVNSSRRVPRLRFPEFKNLGEWVEKRLGEVSILIDDRVKGKRLIPMSITSGIGLISQAEKFGREIAGEQYKNYVAISQGDFAYNKSATKQYPEGYIAMLEDYKEAAVPPSIFTCFRIIGKEFSSPFLKHFFSANFHGIWLRKFIEVGARAHGSLAIDVNILFRMPINFPSLPEQQKIADCLSSLDDLINVHTKKLEVLEAYKKGMMQQLFPTEGEKMPRLRFSEFQNRPEWEKETIDNICTSFSGGTPTTTQKEYYGGSISFIRSAEIDSNRTELFITDIGLSESSAKLVSKGDLLVALYGANSGEVALSKIDGAINQAIMCLKPKCNKGFLYHSLVYKKDWLVSTYVQGGQGNLSGEIIKSIELDFPSLKEQQKIADCLSSLDDLIAAQSTKIDVLKEHKKGLMQQLFPAVDEGEV